MKNRHPKVLVISHNSFSKQGSNGRTLANFFVDWPKESLAQFYISNEIPDSEVCDNYYRVSDVEALKSFISGTKVGKKVQRDEKKIQNSDLSLNKIYKMHREKKTLNYVIRNFVWDSNRWKNNGFEQWINDFSPEVILLQLGDYSFMLRIAMRIAKEKKIPIIIYNSEDYYFKNKQTLSPVYHYYRKDYKRQVKELITHSSHSIYNSEMLQNTYDSEFNHESSVVMTSTNIVIDEPKRVVSSMEISYLGNLGVGRHESLIEIAETLQSLDQKLYLNIYGKAPNIDIETLLRKCKGIKFKGFVSYNEVVSVMKSSDLLVHAENFSEFYQRDLRHAFSTKIADSLSSGTCLFVYAPSNLAFYQYLAENGAACLVDEKKQLKNVLKQVVYDKQMRENIVSSALRISQRNHQLSANQQKVKEIIFNAIRR